ncbi:MAG: SusC/RagA family TonB-linked outer membrane protein, partial [Sphingobacteriaceae bacterium]
MKNFLPYFIFVLCLLAYNMADAQNITVKGTVTDNSGGALPGVSITIKNSSQGVSTNANGEYQLSNVSGTDTLVFSMISFATQNIGVANRPQINVTLRASNTQLDEIVVVGYGTQKKLSVTGAISTVAAKDLTQAPAIDVTNALAGRLPGLIVQQQSGEPGVSGSSLNIRGFGAPLVIVDGVEAPIGNLDAKEIETISILKDASAAVYGARAGNGVILVTTKRGKLGKPTVQLTSAYSLQTVTVAPKTLNAGQYAEIIREAELNSGTPETGLRFTQEEVDKYKQGTEPGYQGADWYDAIMNKYSPLLQTGLSVSGGSERIKYYTFLGFTQQTGMYKSGDNKFRRYNLRSNVDGQISKDLSVSMDIA